MSHIIVGNTTRKNAIQFAQLYELLYSFHHNYAHDLRLERRDEMFI